MTQNDRSVRSVVGVLVLVSVTVWSSALLACEGGARPPPAGNQPLPSSYPMRPQPAADDTSGPMFPGPPRSIDIRSLGRGDGLAKMIREDRERYEREHRGPERIAPGGEGLAFARRLVAGLRPADGPCEEAWEARVIAARNGGQPAGSDRDRREFLASCHRLPAAQQSCMSPLYAQQHGEECVQVQHEITAQLQRESGMDLEHARIPRGAVTSTEPMGRGRTPRLRGTAVSAGTPPPPLAPGPVPEQAPQSPPLDQ